jgi:hypothetical protein
MCCNVCFIDLIVLKFWRLTVHPHISVCLVFVFVSVILRNCDFVCFFLILYNVCGVMIIGVRVCARMWGSII